jgi:ubiquinone/menaquinone biosynthesis C-methylase UbiE
VKNAAILEVSRVASAFDQIAPTYDEVFTQSVIGRAQRKMVWDELQKTFREGQHILELNCGTGEDALFLSSRGVKVLACDCSPKMIAMARRKRTESAGNIEFRVLPSERLEELRSSSPFDGAFSNFSGMNCVTDVKQFVASLAEILKPRAKVLVCVSGRFCLWELAWFLLKGLPRKAFRRVGGSTTARMEGREFAVVYPTIRQWRSHFHPLFRLRKIRAVGLFIPPSYVESWARRHPRLVERLARMDRFFARQPWLRAVGDHVLLEFERAPR